ncbi:MAG TPA: hypothetical protein VNF04_06230 [Stellaceae bacterium]|nr:hypothetical protein [Stellaceae bacterium]
MQMADILAMPTVRMAYFKKKAEAVITGLERPINEHLLRLAAIATDNPGHWRTEAIGWLDEVANIRLRPNNRPGSRAWYFRILFDEPFGGVEVANVTGRLQRLAKLYGDRLREDADPVELAERLRAFHDRFASRCAAGDLSVDDIATMVDRFAAGLPLADAADSLPP